MAIQIILNPKGQGCSIYDESFDCGCLGEIQIRRAGHCEPDEHGQWWADLSPTGGPKLGPFTQRSRALEAEVAWLREALIPINACSRKEVPMRNGAIALIAVFAILCLVGSCDRGCAQFSLAPKGGLRPSRKEVKHEKGMEARDVLSGRREPGGRGDPGQVPVGRAS